MSAEERLLALCELAQAGLVSTSMLHEIRQPVFALQALVQQTRVQGWSETVEQDLATLVEHLEEILRTWSPVGRPDDARLHDVRESVDDGLKMLRPRVHGARAQVVFVRPEQPVWCEQRPSLARQLVLNLVRNALDAIPTGGRIEIRLAVEGGEIETIRLEVEDDGPGIEPAIAASIFEPFTTSKGAEGTGLGLYISRQICRSAGGEVTLSQGPTVARATFRVSPG